MLSIILAVARYSYSIAPSRLTTIIASIISAYPVPISELGLVRRRAQCIKGLFSSKLSASQASVGPTPAEQISSLLAQLSLSAGNVMVRNSVVNGINNTTGGLIVQVNTTPNQQGSSESWVPGIHMVHSIYFLFHNCLLLITHSI